MRKPILNTQRLKEKRESKGWSKNYAAEEMGLLQSVYFRYESGESAPSFSAIKNMALTLGTSVEYLTDKTDDDTPYEFIVTTKDPRLSLIIELYSDMEDDTKTRLYKYAKKLSSLKK